MKPKDENVPVDIFTGSGWETAMVKHLLENEGIEAFIKDENMSTVAPMYVSPGAWGAVTVVISGLDYEKARLIVEEYEKKYSKKNK